MRTGAFTGMSTEQLADEYILTQEEQYFEELLARTEKIRYKLAEQYGNIPGMDREDLLSEGMMEMFRITKHFDSSKSHYTTFLFSALSNKYMKLFNTAMNYKNLASSTADSYERLRNGQKGNECNEQYRDYGNIIFSVECPEYGMIELMDVIERAELSDRERVTIQLILRGNTKPEIAQFLNVTTPTVHSYLRRVYNKLRLAIA